MVPSRVANSGDKNAALVNCFHDVKPRVNEVTRCDTPAESTSGTPEVLRHTDECLPEDTSKYFEIPVIKIALDNDTDCTKSVEIVSKYFNYVDTTSDEVLTGAENVSGCILNEDNTSFNAFFETSQDSDVYSQISEEEYIDREFRLSQLNSLSDEIIVENFFNMSPRPMPESPHRIIEEEFRNNPWVMLVATIFLTKTAGLAARPFMKRFFAEFPNPYAVLHSDPSRLEVYFETLGMRKRAAMIWKMSYQFVSAKWRRASDLYGIGKYGEDAYRLFCLGHVDVEPSDRYLKLYLDWLMSQTDHGEVWGISDCEGVIFDPVAKYYAISLR